MVSYENVLAKCQSVPSGGRVWGGPSRSGLHCILVGCICACSGMESTGTATVEIVAQV